VPQVRHPELSGLHGNDFVVKSDARAKETGNGQGNEPKKAGTDDEKRLEEERFPVAGVGLRELVFGHERVRKSGGHMNDVAAVDSW
jgi:hypothetical protein